MFRIGDQIGSYFLIQKIGRGSFGEVWLAEEKTAISTHKVALKLPNEEDIDLEAIRQEASVWETVKGHPNILPIIKADNVDGQIYIASEYAPDGSLNKWLKKYGGKAPTTEIAVKMTQGILSGLEHLHSKGVIHRDLKPENILLQSDTPRIADFGIARLMQSTSKSTQATGTPAFMAPECFYAIRSVQTDIWSVGIIFHLLLTGKLPFPQPDQISVMHAILNGGPKIQNDILPIYREIIDKALQKNLTQRYLSVAEMQEDLDGLGTKVFPRKEDKIVFQLSDEPEYEVEETLVVPKLLQNQTTFFGARKFIGIAVALSVILIVTAVWAGFQFGKKENVAETKTLDATNTNSGLNVSSEILTNANLNENITVSNKKLPTESNSRRNQTSISPTPYVLQPRNSHDRDDQSERQVIDPNDYDIMTPTPIPRKTPMPVNNASMQKTPTPQRMITEDCRYNRRCN